MKYSTILFLFCLVIRHFPLLFDCNLLPFSFSLALSAFKTICYHIIYRIFFINSTFELFKLISFSFALSSLVVFIQRSFVNLFFYLLFTCHLKVALSMRNSSFVLRLCSVAYIVGSHRH